MIKKRLLGLLSHARKYIVYQVLWQILALSAQVVLAFCIAWLIGTAFAGDLTLSLAMPRFLAAALMIALRFVCDKEASMASFRASADVKRILRRKLTEKLLRLGPAYREQTTSSEVMQLAVEGIEQLETYFGRFIPQFFYAMTAPVLLFAVLSFVDFGAALVLLVCVPLIPIVIMAVQMIAKRLLSRYWTLYAELGDSFLENLHGLTTLKIFQADGQKAVEMDAEAEHFRKITMKVLTMQLNSTAVMDIVAYGGAALGMVKVLSDYYAGSVDLTGAVTVILLAAEFFLPMRLLGSFFHIAMNGMAASDRIFALFDLPEAEEKGETLEEAQVPIELRQVTYAYPVRTVWTKKKRRKAKAAEAPAAPAKNPEVLHGIDMSFPVGFSAVVGSSGCGKSTVAGILAGRSRGYGGSILLAGKELKDLREDSLAAHLTLVGSDSYLFKGTVRDNLLMGKPDATEEEMKQALDAVRLLDFCEAENGLDTPLAEKASNLSGGQRQRLAIARALLRDSAVYIFDEATSNIDPASEAAILEVIHSLARSKTVIMISHRLVNVAGADRIYFLEHGNVTEAGTHAELMEKDGGYARQYRAQHALETYGKEGEKKREKIVLAGAMEKPAEKTEDGKAKASGEKRRKRRSGIAIMADLVRLVRPLLPVMAAAVTLGVIGYLCAIFLSVRAMGALSEKAPAPGFFAGLVLMAVLRGVFHCGEQYANHYIAFRLLALIRHRVFAALRKLCPAKLEGKDKGNLVTLITSDIELLEVFYAHTISPIAIGALVSLIMVCYIGARSLPAALLALFAYVSMGVLLPLWNSGRGREDGMALRDGMGDLGSLVLRFLYGLDEEIQYGHGMVRVLEMEKRSLELADLQKKLAEKEALQRALTDLLIQLFSWAMLLLMLCTFAQGNAGVPAVLTAVAAMMGSFGPVTALANLSNNLNHTLASGERVLSLLEEEPAVEEVPGAAPLSGSGAELENVSFSYEGDGEKILDGCSAVFEPARVTGIFGPSGMGKSTILKLLMRFWDAQSGTVRAGGEDVKKIATASLRDAQGYVTQETWIFHDTIGKNIAVGKPGASAEEIEAAAKKAALHDFIMSLPKGYDTPAGELGDTLSDGEKQRIGIARAFLHDADLLLLDEPTSNLDALNEGMILKSLAEEAGEKTILLVSHRPQAMNIADTVLEVTGSRAG